MHVSKGFHCGIHVYTCAYIFYFDLYAQMCIRLIIICYLLSEPSGPPTKLVVTAFGPSILNVNWCPPIINTKVVSGYFIECVPEGDGFRPPSTTRLSLLSARFYNLTQDTTYNCTVIATSDFGNSKPAMAQAATPPRESMFFLLYFDILHTLLTNYVYMYIHVCVYSMYTYIIILFGIRTCRL